MTRGQVIYEERKLTGLEAQKCRLTWVHSLLRSCFHLQSNASSQGRESKGPACFCEPFYNRTLSHLHASHHLGLITPYRPRVLLPFHEQHLNFEHATFKPQPTHLKAPLLPSASWNAQVNQLQASSQSGPQSMAKSEVPFVGSVNL